MSEETIYIQKIKQAIQSYAKGIKEVNNLEFVNILDYSDKNVKVVSEMIINNRIGEIEKLHADTSVEENLIIISFKDKDGNQHFVTIYDNEELWQNPIVVEIY